MKNFVPRCVAALAGNGAILIAVGNYIASEPRILERQAPVLGGVMLVAIMGVVCAYSALEHEDARATTAAARLKWSARLFFGSIFGLAAALLTAGLR